MAEKFNFSSLNLSSSNLYSSTEVIKPALKLVVPIWLDYTAKQIIESAKNYASSFGSANRKFWYDKSSFGTTFTCNIFCNGPYVEATAWDLEFSVPPGGFKYGDIDPLTGEQFPGGISKQGPYISLVDKPEVEGERVKSVARTYNKYSGRIIKKAGFFSQAIRKNIGSGVILSDIGRDNLQSLGYLLGREICQNMSHVIKREIEGLGLGYIVYVGPVQTATIET
jgi:hypothetical protein